MTPELFRQYGNRRAEVAHLIRYEMRKRGYNGTTLARELGCSRENVSHVLRGISHSPRVLDALRAVGVPEELLFDPRKIQVTSLKEAKAQERV